MPHCVVTSALYAIRKKEKVGRNLSTALACSFGKKRTHCLETDRKAALWEKEKDSLTCMRHEGKEEVLRGRQTPKTQQTALTSYATIYLYLRREER